jgi:hypothetical protein
MAPLMPTAVVHNGSRRVWQREYGDRFIRNERHLVAAKEYIAHSPIKAGLVVRAEDWLWSSAGYAREQEPGWCLVDLGSCGSAGL